MQGSTSNQGIFWEETREQFEEIVGWLDSDSICGLEHGESLAGAEAVLCLPSVYINGDWDEYWRFHLLKEHQRNYLTL